MGGIAMTRRSITTVLASLLVALLLTVNAPALSADSGSPLATKACTHPPIGFPTCYTLQADGTWAREELSDIDMGWVVVGTVTADEVAAAIADANGPAVPVASMGPAVAVQTIGYRFIEVNSSWLPKADAPDPYAETLTQPVGQNR
jgi:hypothetical protein